MTENFLHLCAKHTPNNWHLLQNEETHQGSLMGSCNCSLHKRNWSYLPQCLPHPLQTPWALWQKHLLLWLPSCPGMSQVPAMTDAWINHRWVVVCAQEKGRLLCAQGGVWLLWIDIWSRVYPSTESEANTPNAFFAFNFFQVQKQRKACFSLPCRINLLDASLQFLY